MLIAHLGVYVNVCICDFDEKEFRYALQKQTGKKPQLNLKVIQMILAI